MSKHDTLTVPGCCAGHPQHPELLWVFKKTSDEHLKLLRVETDFALPPPPPTHFSFQNFYVDMGQWESCPYCEASLYFFCKQCKSLNCFSWSQVEEGTDHWSCPTCQTLYKMRPKTSPFQVAAAIDNSGETTSRKTTNLDISALGNNSNPSHTQTWHPSKK